MLEGRSRPRLIDDGAGAIHRPENAPRRFPWLTRLQAVYVVIRPRPGLDYQLITLHRRRGRMRLDVLLELDLRHLRAQFSQSQPLKRLLLDDDGRRLVDYRRQ